MLLLQASAQPSATTSSTSMAALRSQGLGEGTAVWANCKQSGKTCCVFSSSDIVSMTCSHKHEVGCCCAVTDMIF